MYNVLHISNMTIEHETLLGAIWQVLKHHKQSDKAQGPLVSTRNRRFYRL